MNNPYTLLTASILLICCLSGCNRDSFSRPISDNAKQKDATIDMAVLCSRGGAQLELSVETPRGQHEVTPELLEMVRKSLLKRITTLGVEDVSVIASSRQSLAIQIPGVQNSVGAERLLGGIKQLRFGKQKAGTEMQLAVEASVQKELKRKQIELRGSRKSSEILKNKIALQESTEALARMYDQLDLTGANIKDVSPETQDEKLWSVSIEFDEQGAHQFAAITKSLAGTGLSLGAFLDDELVSAPVVDAKFAQTGIGTGKVTISSQLSANEANDLAAKLRGGALPVSMHLVESRTVEKNTPCNYQVSQSLNNGSAFEVEPGKMLNATEMQRLVASYQLADGHYPDQLKIADQMLSQYVAAGVNMVQFETLAARTNTDLLDLVALDAILRVAKDKETPR
jgi:hypothetical protein